ncbi:ABC-three component system middle component 5 [Aeromonas sobria]|uniref:ABC-three component system middle component 5 n=1 Tax=Aeromonas sobria TaxID=646 RepID=UPI003F681FFD
MYHPAQDINHCVYRLLLILECSKHKYFNIDLYKLIDFYILFPHLIKLIKPLPKSISKFRKDFANIPDSYESIRNSKRIFHDLENLQSTAVKNLLAKDFLDKEAFEHGVIKRSKKLLPEHFSEKIQSARLYKQEWFRVLINEFPNSKLIGSNGLKFRTGLIEYRYDMESA